MFFIWQIDIFFVSKKDGDRERHGGGGDSLNILFVSKNDGGRVRHRGGEDVSGAEKRGS